MNQLQLRDIHLPDFSPWWPPAPGWWFLALLLILAMLLLPRLIRYLKRRPLRAISLRQIGQLRQAFEEGRGEKAVVRELSALMRRIVISYQGRSGSAALSGDAWIEQITRLAPGAVFSAQQLQLLGRERYRRDYDVDLGALLRSCENWVRALPRRGGDDSA